MLNENDKPENAKSNFVSEADGSDCSAADRGTRSTSQTSDCSTKSDDTGYGSEGTSETEAEDIMHTIEHTMIPLKLHGKRPYAPADGADTSSEENPSPKLRKTYFTRSMRPKDTFPRPNDTPLLRKWAHGRPLRLLGTRLLAPM
jgi:hypothetical protein